MKKNSTNNRQLAAAHFINEFALNGRVDFNNATEWLIFLYSISLLDSMNETELPKVSYVPISDLKLVLKENKSRSGDFYNQVKKTVTRMAKAVCIFETDLVLGGVRMPKVISIFSSIGVEKRHGQMCISIDYNDKIAPLVLGLKKNFVGIKPPVSMTSGHAINFLLYAKAERDKRRKYDGKTTVIRFELEALRNRMDLVGRYPKWEDFKRRVIKPIISGVNKSGMIIISDVEYEKTGRKISHILFFVQDAKQLLAALKPQIKNNEATLDELAALSYAQKRALKFLMEKGIYEGIAVRKIIPQMPSSICEGYEDYFCEEIYKIVEEKSKAKDDLGRAAVMVGWFKKGIFKNDYFSRIIENVHQRKKVLSEVKLMNRLRAKNMTAQQFVEWTKNQAIAEVEPKGNSPQKPKSVQSIGDVIKKKLKRE